ncbi:MAG TPA: hypothetical protein VK502_03575 [Candidatus Saccharimonadales bacterium]|nr:hypothetical protein [Candidatus Saccharimonadales bacterium]
MSHLEIPVVSVEKAKGFDSLHIFAVEALRDYRKSLAKNQSSREQLERYHELADSKKLNFAKHRRLRAWLKLNELQSEKYAPSQLNDAIERSDKEVEITTDRLSGELDTFREKHLKKYSPMAKQRFQELVFANGMPSAVMEEYQRGGAESIVDWLAQETPGGEGGATDEQLAQLLEWNIEKTEEIAQNPEIIRTLTKDYFDNIQQATDDGRLHPDWRQETARVDEVVIGDIFDLRFVGHNDKVRGGSYSSEHKNLVVWPYEPGDEPLSPHIFGHEMTHSMGGVGRGWMNEAFTEKFASIIDGYDPVDSEFATYQDGQDVLDSLVQNAPEKLTYFDISEHYIGDDKEKNEEEVRKLFKRAYRGYDVLGTAIEIGEAVAPGTVINGTEKETDMVSAIHHAVTEIMLPVFQMIKESNIHPTTAARGLKDLADKQTNQTDRLMYVHCAQMFANKEDINV